MLAITYGVVGFVAVLVLLAKRSQRPNLHAFPTVGSSTWLGSWLDALKFLTNSQSIIQEGYEKYKTAPFKVAELYNWTVIISDRRHIEELAKAPESTLSFLEAIDNQVQVRYTLGPEIIDNPYHVAVARTQLTRNLQVLYPAIRDEIVVSFDEILDLREHEWKGVPALRTIEKIVCRTSNRLFVGLPLCRNPDWIDLNLRYSMDVIKGGVVIGCFPTFVRALATRFLTNIPYNIARGVKHLCPIIEERQKYFNEYGVDWDEKPNDLLSWLMEQAEGPELAAERLTNRILVTNFAAIHSSSHSFTQALFNLAANPRYIQQLRDEVESITEKEGWTKIALGKMRKVDSFLKESQRMQGVNIVTLSRKVLKDFTLSDGTFLPKGTSVAAATSSLHHNRDFYENPDAFEPFRFVNIREEDGMAEKYQFASTTTEYLPFGLGKHACPGRFFAADELKLMLAHIVLMYDVKLEDNTKHPRNLPMSTFIAADPHAKVIFRNRMN